MKQALLLASALLLSQSVFAAGFEKGIPWGGESAGLAGIGSPYMTGSQALFFNPAGLVGEKTGDMDLTFNISPTWPTFKSGIYATDSTSYTSKSTTYLPGALMFGQTLSDKLGWGAGVYVSGGNQSEFDNLTIGTQGPFTAKAALSIIEASAGVGYKVMDNLKIGAAYRVAFVNADLDSEQAITSGPLAGKVMELDYSGLKDTNFFGYKVGAQYKLNDTNKLGLVYRSEMNFKAKGTYTSHAPAAGTAADFSGDATIGSVFPEAITLGYEHDCTETWKSFAEVYWAQYSKVTNLAINNTSGSLTGVSAQELQNKDLYVARLAAAYSGWSWPVRFGFAWTSQVTNGQYALATSTPPAPQYTVTAGTGQSWGNFHLNGGLEYSWGSGTPDGFQVANSVVDYSLHLGAGYTF
jgi:long-subunit fatty acid transport protein